MRQLRHPTRGDAGTVGHVRCGHPPVLGRRPWNGAAIAGHRRRDDRFSACIDRRSARLPVLLWRSARSRAAGVASDVTAVRARLMQQTLTQVQEVAVDPAYHAGRRHPVADGFAISRHHRERRAAAGRNGAVSAAREEWNGSTWLMLACMPVAARNLLIDGQDDGSGIGPHAQWMAKQPMTRSSRRGEVTGSIRRQA